MGQGIREDITSGDLDCLLEKIMLENDEAGVPCRSVANDILPVLKYLLNIGSTTMNVEVYTYWPSVICSFPSQYWLTVSVESGNRADASPHNRCKPHSN
jgi:hypothetical protein